MSAESSIQGQMDRFAALRQAWQGVNGGTDFWTRVDAAGDEVYENRVKGQDITDLDTAIANADFGSLTNIGKWISLHQAYLANPTSGPEPGLGYTTDPWNSWLAAMRWRVPYGFNELFYNRMGVRLNPLRVFPKGTWSANIGDNSSAGLHKFADLSNSGGTWSLTAADGALDVNVVQGAAVILVSDDGVTGSVSGTITCTNQQGQDVNVAVSSLSLPADQQAVLGAEAIITDVSEGNTNINVTLVDAFTAGDAVILIDDNNMEIGIVNSIEVGVLHLAQGTRFGYTTTASAYVWPLYINVTDISNFSGGSDGESIQIYARPDRAIAL